MCVTFFARYMHFIHHSSNKQMRPNLALDTILGTRGRAVNKKSSALCVYNTVSISAAHV